MILARIWFEGEGAEAVSRSLDPDNLSGMRVAVTEGAMEVEFSAERAGTILATADDLIMNAKIALDLLNNGVRS
ncbi:MAG: KEOPS complex subunit Pcc1 [Methanothrix sp.]